MLLDSSSEGGPWVFLLRSGTCRKWIEGWSLSSWVAMVACLLFLIPAPIAPLIFLSYFHRGIIGESHLTYCPRAQGRLWTGAKSVQEGPTQCKLGKSSPQQRPLGGLILPGRQPAQSLLHPLRSGSKAFSVLTLELDSLGLHPKSTHAWLRALAILLNLSVPQFSQLSVTVILIIAPTLGRIK